jgi:hypothetical protein
MRLVARSFLLMMLGLVAASCASTTDLGTSAPSPEPSVSAPASAPPSVAASAEPSASGEATATPVPSVEAFPHEIADGVNEALRDELLAMMAEDQAVRTGIAPPGDDRTPDELFAAWDAVDAANARRMEEILEEHGWPGWSLVGEEAATAAWVLIQHADLRLPLQELGLAYLQGAVDAGDASPGDLAYLIDRVRVAKGQPQLYGTQLGADANGDLAPRTPIEDPENVDERRAAMGLGTLEEYYEEFRDAMEEFEEPSASASEGA